MILTIDAGVTCCGWATWKHSKLFACGLSRTQKTTIEERARDHEFEFRKIDRLVIEKPEVYQQRFWKGDPRDLIDLAMIVGAIIKEAPPEVLIQTVFPKQWKGQVPREVEGNRTRKKLDSTELALTKKPEVYGRPTTAPPSLIHNMFSAIGIGLWVVGR